MATVRLANAPVSFGVFELTAYVPDLPAADALAAAVAGAGYEGIDLGPVGYLGDRVELPRRLARHGLALCGGWVEFRLPDDAGFAADLELLDPALDVFAAAADGDPRFHPRPTLADAGSPARSAHVGQVAAHPELGLDDGDWKTLVTNAQRAADRCRERGLEPTFHHHAGTYVETPQEIERLLGDTDIGLCLDTGHLLLGGGDPLTAWRDWGARINHLHVKDARLDVLAAAVRDQASMEEIWRRGVFCRLGAGDLDVDGFLRAVRDSDYAGWLVVEQDVVPPPGAALDALTEDQTANREFLRARGW